MLSIHASTTMDMWMYKKGVCTINLGHKLSGHTQVAIFNEHTVLPGQ